MGFPSTLLLKWKNTFEHYKRLKIAIYFYVGQFPQVQKLIATLLQIPLSLKTASIPIPLVSKKGLHSSLSNKRPRGGLNGDNNLKTYKYFVFYLLSSVGIKCRKYLDLYVFGEVSPLLGSGLTSTEVKLLLIMKLN